MTLPVWTSIIRAAVMTTFSARAMALLAHRVRTAMAMVDDFIEDAPLRLFAFNRNARGTRVNGLSAPPNTFSNGTAGYFFT